MEESQIEIRTLIPEADSYGIAILIVLGLSTFTLAADVHSRWLSGTNVGLYHVYCGALGLVSIWGALIVNAGQLLGTSALGWVLSVPVGLAAGGIAGWADRAIIRFINRRSVVRQQWNQRSKAITPRSARSEARSIRPSSIPFPGQAARRRELGIYRVRRIFQPSSEYRDAGVWPLVIAAALEELIYRGFLVSVCFQLPSTSLIAVALIGIVIAFAFSHIWFGWAHVLAKLPLGAAAMVVVLTLGTVLPAIAAHVLFNLNVWKDMRLATPTVSTPDKRITSESRRILKA